MNDISGDIYNKMHDFQDLFYEINGGYDVILSMINEYDYETYKVDFSRHPVTQIFFTGTHDYFPAVVYIKDVPFDQCPIYMFDFEEGLPQFMGNLKTYLTELISNTSDVSFDQLNEFNDWLETLSMYTSKY